MCKKAYGLRGDIELALRRRPKRTPPRGDASSSEEEEGEFLPARGSYERDFLSPSPPVDWVMVGRLRRGIWGRVTVVRWTSSRMFVNRDGRGQNGTSCNCVGWFLGKEAKHKQYPQTRVLVCKSFPGSSGDEALFLDSK
jgi:hypothetical protein